MGVQPGHWLCSPGCSVCCASRCSDAPLLVLMLSHLITTFDVLLPRLLPLLHNHARLPCHRPAHSCSAKCAAAMHVVAS